MTTMPSWFMPLVGGLLFLLLAAVTKLAADVSKIQGERAITCKVHGEQLKAIEDCQKEMSKQVDRLVWRQEQDDAHAADGLHSPTHRERDILLVGLMSGTLSVPEIERLIVLLRQAKIDHSTGAEERMYASHLLGRAEWELLDRRRQPDGH
jgi:hypothetical protein